MISARQEKFGEKMVYMGRGKDHEEEERFFATQLSSPQQMQVIQPLQVSIFPSSFLQLIK